MNLQHAHLRLVDAVLNHLVDVALDIRVVEHRRLNHHCLCIVIVCPAYVISGQPGAFQEEDGLRHIGIEHVPNLIHRRPDKFLDVVVVQVIALDELIVQIALMLQLLGAGLGNTEGIAILHAIRDISLTAWVAVPQLQHRSGQHEFDIPNIHLITPSVLHCIGSGHLLGKILEVERENHTLLPRKAGVHSRNHVVQPKLFAPPLRQGRHH